MAQRQYEAATCSMRVRRHAAFVGAVPGVHGKADRKAELFWFVDRSENAGALVDRADFCECMQAFSKLLAGQFQNFAQNPNAVVWPITDGDMPSPPARRRSSPKVTGCCRHPPATRRISSWCKSGAVAPVKLHSRVGVKPGDHCMLGVTAAVKQNQPNGVKFYLNACVFTHPGEEIVFANSVSGAELMRQAQRRACRLLASPGLRVALAGRLVAASVQLRGRMRASKTRQCRGRRVFPMERPKASTRDLPRRR
jgi:hypothetical protein